MVVGVQYEALGNQQVIIPDLVAAYQRGKEMKQRQKQFDIMNRQGELANQRAETAQPYYKDQLEQQKKQGELAIEKYGRDKMMSMVEYAQRFIPQANSVEDLMGLLKSGEDAGLIDPEISRMVLSGIPESAINNPDEFAKIRDRLLYGAQLFEHQLQLSKLEASNKYREQDRQADFENKKALLGMENSAARARDERNNAAAMELQGLRNQGDIEQTKLMNDRYQNTRTPSLLGKLYQEQQNYEQGSDMWNTYQDKIDNYAKSGSGTLSPLGKSIKEQSKYAVGTPEYKIYQKRIEKDVADNGGLTYRQAREEAVNSLEFNPDSIDFTMDEREQYISDYIDNMKKSGVPISGTKADIDRKTTLPSTIKDYDPVTKILTLPDGRKFNVHNDGTLSPVK